MIDLDIYRPNPFVEEFLQSLKASLKKTTQPIKIYISTASQDNHLLKKLYNNTELMENRYEKICISWQENRHR